MRKRYFVLPGIIVLCFSMSPQLNAQQCGVSAIYGGGPFYKYSSTSIPEIKNSGFTTAIVWTIHINSSGNLNFNGEFAVATNGQYVGTIKYPGFPKYIALLKTAPTSVTRVEFGLSAAGSSTFQNIKNLVSSQGTGPTSILYRNFKALKDSIPAVDAINFDDETTFDIASSVQFAVMLADLGYKVALCPYNNANYWTSVASQTNAQRPGTVDVVFLQCYDGGVNNNPCTWNFNGIPIYPGLWDINYTPAGVETKMLNWKNQCGISGGFMWLYDDFDGTTKTAAYADAINNAFESPGPTVNISPPDSSINVSTDATLNWNSASCANSHDVYFGTSASPPFIGNQTGINYNPGTLALNTQYYWRVDGRNSFGTSTGTVWSFTTGITSSINPVLPEEIYISQNYPNPFNEHTSMEVHVAQSAEISVFILNQYGQKVKVLASNINSVGRQTFTWRGENDNGQKVFSGLYTVQVMSVDAKGKTIIKSSKIVYQNR